MVGIIRSKENLITAIKTSRNSKDTGAVSQEDQNTTKKTVTTFSPIKFLQPAAYTGGTYPFAHAEYLWYNNLSYKMACYMLLNLCRCTRSCSTGVTRSIFLVNGPSRTQQCNSS
jgi:hypothetical protein